jgi:hypothetical protein
MREQQAGALAMFGSMTSPYSCGCTMSGVSTATISASFTASAGVFTVKPSALP